jgi:hypothetical protein
MQAKQTDPADVQIPVRSNGNTQVSELDRLRGT